MTRMDATGGADTSDEAVYLRPDVKVEPLVNGWYAWPHAMAPLQHARNLAHRYLPLLQSFVDTPDYHVMACQDPALLGGPFVDLKETQVEAVRELIAATERRSRSLLEFNEAFDALDARIVKTMNGYSLDQCYQELPPSLRGLVEMAYDHHQRPIVRLREEMVARHGPDLEPLQSVRLTRRPDESRAFFLSTPRLDEPGAPLLTIPFRNPALDQLARLRTVAAPGNAVERDLAALGLDQALGRDFFTSQPPVRNAPNFRGDGVRIRYFGHACVLIEAAGTAILVDPLITCDQNPTGDRLTLVDLPDFIDLVVISHGHADHFCLETLLQIRHKIGRIVTPRGNRGSVADPCLRLMLRQAGFENVTAADAFDVIETANASVTLLPFPGEHADLDILSRQGIAVTIAGRQLVFLVDSNAVDVKLYEHLASDLGRIDMLFVGMECHGAPLSWLYGPLLAKPASPRDDASRRLDSSDARRAWRVVEILKPSEVYVYAMGQEPWLRYMMGMAYTADSVQLQQAGQLIAQCRANGMQSAQLEGCSEFFL